MSRTVFIDKELRVDVSQSCDIFAIKEVAHELYRIPVGDMYAVSEGKLASDTLVPKHDVRVELFTRLVGGKGGFGSMLRAIGAQIEKTTNREACRDLSGRRLRDINEEQRLRKWLNSQADREKEVQERKQRKLEKLCAEVTPVEVTDKAYAAERAALPERGADAVAAGWLAASTSLGATKRKNDCGNQTKNKKKAKLWIDADLSDGLTDSDDEESEDGTSVPKLEADISCAGQSNDSGHDSDRASSSSTNDTNQPTTSGTVQLQ